VYIFCGLGLASCRWRQLTSNVRPALKILNQSVNTPRRGVSACQLVSSLRVAPNTVTVLCQGAPKGVPWGSAVALRHPPSTAVQRRRSAAQRVWSHHKPVAVPAHQAPNTKLPLSEVALWRQVRCARASRPNHSLNLRANGVAHCPAGAHSASLHSAPAGQRATPLAPG
jgi:hypothetical protein